MTARAPLTVDTLAALARAYGIPLTRERLAAILEEVDRLQGHVARLEALPLDDVPPVLPSVEE